MGPKAISAVLGVWALGSAASASIVLGPDWDEVGDAGSLPGSAQVVSGTGPLSTIRGTLSSTAFGGDQQDMYLIYITAPTMILGGGFSATTSQAAGGSTEFQSALWLFDFNGFGLLGTTASEQMASFGGGATMGNASTDGTGIMITVPGLYYLAISIADSVPLDASGNAIFAFGSAAGEVSGPDGPGGLAPIGGWSSGAADGGEYIIKLTGVSFVPTPAAAVMLLGMGFRGRRRRRDG